MLNLYNAEWSASRTHGSERSWAASAENIVKRGDCRVSTDACADAAAASDHRSQENALTMLDVEERVVERALQRAAQYARRVT